jgi:UDP-3-O-[3-hydroxymyristoyl] glucosamine N-acyltransferase
VSGLTAGDIAKAVGGRLVGEPNTRITGVAPLDRAGAGDLSFLAAAKYATLFGRSQAGLTLVAPALADSPGPAARVIVADPHEAIISLIPRLYAAPVRSPGVHPTARIGRGAVILSDVTIDEYAVIQDGARIGERSWVGPHAVVGTGVSIGADVRLCAHVTVYPGTTIGERVTVHAGARLGCDGFGYVFRDGAHAKIPHVGRCVIESDVEIGANTTIDRGSVDDTIIGAGTKIDNLVHVAHNVRIGRLCLLMAQVGIAGSTHIGDGCILAGQVGVAGHRTIGDGARLAAQAGVFGNVPAGESWSGYPARPHTTALRAQATLFKLPELMRALERLIAEKDAKTHA